jgi:ParB family chromosome partitioning protein
MIQAIGAAPSVGRDRWLKLADLLSEDRMPLAIDAAEGETSDARFEAVLKALTPRKAPAPRSDVALLGADGTALGQMRRSGTKTVLTLNTKAAKGFEDWLAENISDLHHRWKTSRDE